MNPTRYDAPAGSLAGRIGRLLRGNPLGRGVSVGVAGVDEPRPAALHPHEWELAVAMSTHRRADFTLGRQAARRALAALALDGPVTVDGRRPVFPAGSVGSITHSGGIAVSTVAPRGTALSVGVDVELAALPPQAVRMVCDDVERDWVLRCPTEVALRRLRALFCAKEAAFKALDPLLPGQLGNIRRIVVRPAGAGVWTARLRDGGGPPCRVVMRHCGPAAFAFARCGT